MKKKKRFLGILLGMVLLLGLLPGMSLSALAYDGDPYADMVNTTTTVRFNDIDWYIIKDESTSAAKGTVTLFAKDPIGVSTDRCPDIIAGIADIIFIRVKTKHDIDTAFFIDQTSECSTQITDFGFQKFVFNRISHMIPF